VAAFGGREAPERALDGIPEVAYRTGCLSAQDRLELGEDKFDRVEVRVVNRQLEQRCASRLDALADTADLVCGLVVEHDRVAALQGRDQGLLDIAAEAGSGHQPVEKGGGHQAVGAQAGRDGNGFPMPEGDGEAATLGTRRSPVTPRHLRVCCGLVEEHQPIRIEIELSLEPSQAGWLHILLILLGRVAGVFYV
jgi:hypothetical protein